MKNILVHPQYPAPLPILQKLFDDISKRYSSRDGGYTRVVKSRVRIGDCASLSVIELVEKREKAAT